MTTIKINRNKEYVKPYAADNPSNSKAKAPRDSLKPSPPIVIGIFPTRINKGIVQTTITSRFNDKAKKKPVINATT